MNPCPSQDGQAVKPSERIAAVQVVEQLEQQLREELRAEGIDPDQAALAEDDSMFDENGDVRETGHMDEKGEMRRPWCAATRILEHRESVSGSNRSGVWVDPLDLRGAWIQWVPRVSVSIGFEGSACSGWGELVALMS